MLALGRKAVTNLDRILKSRGITLLTKLRFCRVWIWELDYKESWAWKNWCFWTVVLEKTLESPLDCKEIKPVSPKGNQPWIFIGRTDAEAEISILWPPDVKNWLIGKDPDAKKDRRQMYFSLVQFSHSVVSDPSLSHRLLHARFPCPSTASACSNSCPRNWWCHPTISSSVIPFSSHFQSFPVSGSFPINQFA